MRRQSSFKDRWKGSTKSLAGFLKVGPSSLSRQESFTSLAKEEEGLDDDKPRKSNLRRNLSRKMRDIVARSVSYPLTPRGELARAQSLSSLLFNLIKCSELATFYHFDLYDGNFRRLF
eukprot:GFUD01096231.1.p1 GENE.GFUD01096231.1~~GFUD01096231.1.p1  ORF type:complete len:118 (+),score=18.17 GFUD01096231.1:20-373(+)